MQKEVGAVLGEKREEPISHLFTPRRVQGSFSCSHSSLEQPTRSLKASARHPSIAVVFLTVCTLSFLQVRLVFAISHRYVNSIKPCTTSSCSPTASSPFKVPPSLPASTHTSPVSSLTP
ncbi:uncharacterized protein BDZ99DRAFT_125272 [Mytilinidion resinicola]|uniref:Transmembrane protein n=1 Tax=Mytilinidion resinicola TaxID=574789 RepID=A0A6A6Z489_9PEZI|nr:uncharacterized protein BDZ99DRAFT_125272 [Mytilinidion resinicola]KAF2815896.1 hypothetical protein BDZ99DRAFT_125272 [Mytilinidion resinicola]